MKSKILLLAAALVLSIAVDAVRPQQRPAPVKLTTLPSAIMDNWTFMQRSVIGVADAMPAEKYNFAPTNGSFTGVRTFAAQVKHVACANFAFFNEIEGVVPPPDCEKGGPDPKTMDTKPELMKYLRDSYDYSNKVIAKLTPQSLLDHTEGRYAGPNTKIGMVMVAVWHATDHYGQMVEYLRMNGIIPPGSN
ncbi:MAG: DinB family protein [Candidatus Acidiferrales bacterium]